MMMGDTGFMFGYWSLGHWLFFAIIVGLLAYPIGRILNRIGLSPLWSILAFIPIVNLIGLWVIALMDWPRDRS